MMAKLAVEFDDFDMDDVESQISFAVENLGNSNKTKVKQALDVLLYCLRGNYSVDAVRDNWRTISTACYRVLKGQKDELCEKSCYILGILCYYVEEEGFYTELVETLEGYSREDDANHKTVGKFDAWSHMACIAIGIACCIFDEDTISERISFLWTTAISASNRHSGTKAAACINSVTLAATGLTNRQAKKLLNQPKFLEQCVKFLSDENAGVITECGILLAVLLTKARQTIADAEDEVVSFEEVMGEEQVDMSKVDFDDLPNTSKIQKILQISAGQNEKARSKDDNVRVKKMIRRINTVFEEGEYDNIPDINFSQNSKRCEMLKLRSWEDECFYNCLTMFFKGGTQHHLRFNEIVRAYYDLGEPRIADSISDDEDEEYGSGRPLTKQQMKERKLEAHHDHKTNIKTDRKNQRGKKHDMMNEDY